MQDAELFATSPIGKHYDQLFVTQEKKCQWLIDFSMDQLRQARTKQVQVFYLQVLCDAYAWKWRIEKH